MSYLEKSSDNPSKKRYKRWSKELSANGITERVEVEEVSNGFIISIVKYGKEENSEKYIDICTKKISTTNPFENKPKEDSDNESFDGLMKSAINSMDNYL